MHFGRNICEGETVVTFHETFNLSDDRLFSLIYKHLPWVQTARNSSTKLIDAEIDHTNYYANRFYRLNYQSLSARLIELVLSVNEPRSVVRHNCPCDVICGVIIFHYLNALFLYVTKINSNQNSLLLSHIYLQYGAYNVLWTSCIKVITWNE